MVVIIEAGPLARLFYWWQLTGSINVHPLLKILCLIALAYLEQQLTGKTLLSCLGILMAAVLLTRARNFFVLCGRIKWLFLVMLLIYALTTPGEYIRGWPFDFAPTYEGLNNGFIQSIRLLNMLAGVSLLLHTSSRDGLMSGFLLLIYPLKYLGMNVQRFSARLYLTLHYVESSKRERNATGFFEFMHGSLLSHADEISGPEQLDISIPAFKLIDLLVLLILISLLWIYR